MGDKAATNSSKATPLKRKQRHKPGQFAILVVNIVIATACFVGAAILIAGQQVISSIQRTDAITTPSVEPLISVRPPVASVAPTVTTAANDDQGDEPDEPEPTAATFPIADPNARNFLITGTDNGACDDPDSSTQVGERSALGERSDTIMVMRVDPSANRAAVLSFPRDLWVAIFGTEKHGRINDAYEQDNPQKLADTIWWNFGIHIDHSIQVDFCAFKTLVDAVGGVGVPFEYLARDRHTNLNIANTGCVTLDGSTALAYVRSRHYQYLDPNTGKYREDPAADWGRIARQQDFLRRAVAKVLSQGYSVDTMEALIDVATNYVILDRDLTPRKLLEFAGVLKDLDPADIRTYTVEGLGVVKGGASVIEPRLDGPNMQAILAIFQGSAQLESAPEQVFESTTSSVQRTTTSAASPESSTTTTTTRPSGTTTTTLPAVTVEQEVRGIVPPPELCP